MTLKLAKHAALPVALMAIGGVVAKHLDATAGAAIVSAGTLLLGRLMRQPKALREEPPS